MNNDIQFFPIVQVHITHERHCKAECMDVYVNMLKENEMRKRETERPWVHYKLPTIRHLEHSDTVSKATNVPERDKWIDR